MDIGTAVYIIRSSLLQIIIISSPVLLIGMVVGLIISIIQATTSIQEQTLTFVPKIIAILGTLILLGAWMFSSMEQFTLRLAGMIPDMIR